MIHYQKASQDQLDELVHMRMLFLAQMGGDAPPPDLPRRTRAYMQHKLACNEMAVWLACEGAQIVGIALMDIGQTIPNYTRPTGKVGYISNVYTLPAYRKQGIATALMQKLMEEARVRGCDRVTLSTTQMGRPLYQRLGFKPVLHELSWYPPRADGV